MNRTDAKSFGVDVLERSYGRWWLMLLDGLCLILLGALAVFNSGWAISILVLVFGVYRGIMGMIYIIAALVMRHKYGTNEGFSLGRGIFDLVICAIFLLAPNVIVTFFVIIIGIWAIITGIFLLIISGNSSGLGKIIKIIIGVALIAFGIYTFIDPMGPAKILAVIIGVILGITGLLLVVQSIQMKRTYSKIKQVKKGYEDYKIE